MQISCGSANFSEQKYSCVCFGCYGNIIAKKGFTMITPELKCFKLLLDSKHIKMLNFIHYNHFFIYAEIRKTVTLCVSFQNDSGILSNDILPSLICMTSII